MQFDSLTNELSHHQLFFVALGRNQDWFKVIPRQQTSNIDPISVSSIENYPYIIFRHIPTGIDLSVLRIIAARLNRSIEVSRFFCQATESNSDCVARKASQSTTYSVHFDRDVFRSSTVGCVPALTPTVLVIMVPCRGSIDVMELLSNKLQKFMGISILCVSIGCIILRRWIPKLFRNNLILLPWFNFQSYNLHRTGRLERFTMMALIVFTFLMRTAFENHLISFISSWPLKSDVNSLEELMEAGWSVQTALRFEILALHEDPRWKNAIQYQRLQIVGSARQAYLTPAKLYDCFSMLWKAMKFRSTFKILPEQFNLGYGMYYFGSRDGLIDQFEVMQRRLYDTGIYSYWDEIFQEDVYRVFQKVFMLPNAADGKPADGSAIMWEDLMPICDLLMFSWIFAGLVFLLEVICLRRMFCVGRIRDQRIVKSSKRFKRLRGNTYPHVVVGLERRDRRRHSI